MDFGLSIEFRSPALPTFAGLLLLLSSMACHGRVYFPSHVPVVFYGARPSCSHTATLIRGEG